MPKVTRRDFLRATGLTVGGTALGLTPRLLAAAEAGGGAPEAETAAALAALPPGEPPTLVVVYLRGGSDALAAIAPYGDGQYRELRPTIAIAGPGNPDPTNPGVVPLNNYFGFHPALAPLFPFYKAGTFAPILCTGSTHPTRSHFDAQDFMERAAPGVKSITEGWLNRYLTATAGYEERDLRAVSLQATLPRSLRGGYSVLAVPDYGADEAMDAFERMYACQGNEEAKQAVRDVAGAAGMNPLPPRTPADDMRDTIVQAGDRGIRKLRHLNSIIRNGPATTAGVHYPPSHLGSQFRDLAKVIKAGEGLEIAALDYNGWDHHAFQGGGVGTMGTMLGDLAASIAAFMHDLGPRSHKTLVLTMTEFGRTVKENGNSGTDHGHGGYMFAIGGPVKGSRFYGNWTGLDARSLYQGRDLPVHVDFRDVFDEVLECMFGFNADDHQFFPDYSAKERALGFLNPLKKAAA